MNVSGSAVATEGRIIFTAASDSATANSGNIKVRKVLWYGAQNGDSFVIQDDDSNDLCGFDASTYQRSFFIDLGPEGVPSASWTASTLDGGTVILFT